jgi:hypothetical protein
VKWDNLVATSGFVATSTWSNYFSDLAVFQPTQSITAKWFNVPARLSATKRTWSSASNDGLLYALIRGRPSACQDPRDKVYSQLSLGNADIFPSYKQSPTEVYITAAKYILQHSDNLFLLTCVEGEEFQQVLDLPSWVPDWSVPKFLGLRITGYPSFTAAGDRARKLILSTKAQKDILTVEATRFDEIIEIGDTKAEILSFAHPNRFWELISRLDENYLTGESREDVVWRTLITNREKATTSSKTQYPSSKDMGDSFHGT